jgi:hypothetical protein
MPSRLVVKPTASGRQRIVAALAIILALTALAVMYQWGRVAGGDDARESAAMRRQLGARLLDLEAENDELRWELALLRASGRIDREGFSRVSGRFDDLQSQIAELKEQLSFYQGIMSPADGRAGLQIQTVQIQRGLEPGQYRLRLVLVQAGRQGARIRGTVDLTVIGERGGESVTLELDALGAGEDDLTYAFRYFQILERDIVLAPDVAPLQVVVTLNSSRKTEEPLSETFPWQVVGD